MQKPEAETNHTENISLSSAFGLNAVNFFLAELLGVVLPFLSEYLKQHHWEYDKIGVAIALGGMGTFLAQIPAGIASDKMYSRRLLLGGMSLILGACYALLPLFVGSMAGICALLFISGIANAFFVPLLATLALSLVGHKKFDHTMGVNQGWNHAGNIAAALLALLLVKVAGIVYIFYVMGLLSAGAAASLPFIRKKELNPDLTKDKDSDEENAAEKSVGRILSQVKGLMQERAVLMVVVSVSLFHIVNAPAMALVALYLKKLGGSDDKIALAVLIGQTVMIPVALIASRFCSSRGRKPVFAIAFIILPIRMMLYTTTHNPDMVLLIQTLDGVGAGIYGVVIALMCSDLTEGKAGFNTLLAIMQTALALGGVLGPLVQGFVTQNLGFNASFIGFAILAAIGTVVFLVTVPETKDYKKKNRQADNNDVADATLAATAI